MPIRVTQVQATPNPNARKFLLDRPVSTHPTSFFNAESAAGHPLAARLFAIPGVSSLLLLGDFITVNKLSDTDWRQIERDVKRILSK